MTTEREALAAEYTPTIEEVRLKYKLMSNVGEEGLAEFDRWFAQYRPAAEVAEEFIEDLIVTVAEELADEAIHLADGDSDAGDGYGAQSSEYVPLRSVEAAIRAAFPLAQTPTEGDKT